MYRADQVFGYKYNGLLLFLYRKMYPLLLFPYIFALISSITLIYNYFCRSLF